uniref:Fibronectin type-III domain-containing protein n=1 Tax=Globisporangium ultimum (strain ATCC 200006 / CBS 805.95 / DAOM BR144) TaxID=431595 RepID=K3W6S5_GLOUD
MTSLVTQPQAPQNSRVVSVTNTIVLLDWDACIDFGGNYVETYEIEVAEVNNPTNVATASVPITTLNATVEKLSPNVEYYAIIEAVEYFLYRDGSKLVYSGTDVYAEDNSIIASNTYVYTLRVRNANGTLSIASEATTFVASASTPLDTFECMGIKGVIQLQNYANQFNRQWKITPATPTGIILNGCDQYP